MVEGLRALGADIEEAPDGFAVRGDGSPLRGGTIDAKGDHRLAMLGAVAGLASEEGVEVVGMEAAARLLPRVRAGHPCAGRVSSRNPRRAPRVGAPMRAPLRPRRSPARSPLPAAAHATFPGGNGRIALDLRGKNLDEAGQATYRSITTLRSDSRGDKFVRECQITGAGARMGDCAIDYRSPAWSPERAQAGVRRRPLAGADERRRQRLQPAGAVHLG